MKIRPFGAELFHADRRTDMTKLIVAFHNFSNALKISALISNCYCHHSKRILRFRIFSFSHYYLEKDELTKRGSMLTK